MREVVAVDRQRYDALISSALGGGGWFQMHRGIIKALGLDAAALLHFLINYHSRVQQGAGYRWDDGWFFCTVAQVADELGFNKRKQQQLVQDLVERGLLETEKKGLPAKRHFRINPEAVGGILVDWQASGRKNAPTSETTVAPASGRKNAPTLVRRRSKKGVSNKRGAGGRPPGLGVNQKAKPRQRAPDVGEFDLIQGSRLQELARREDLNPKIQNARPESYARVIAKLRRGGKSEYRISRVLAWWVDNYNEAPSARFYKLADFYEKFGQIEDAYKRHQPDAPAEAAPEGPIYDDEDEIDAKAAARIAADGGKDRYDIEYEDYDFDDNDDRARLGIPLLTE